MFPNLRMASGSFSGPRTMRPITRMAITSPPPRLLKMASTSGVYGTRPSGVCATLQPWLRGPPDRARDHAAVALGYPSLIDPPIGFAHRGARAHAPDNTIEAFSLALRLGATGLETDLWLTSDG